MDYIHQLRQHIGHRPILLVGAAILVVDEQECILLLKRSDSGCWGPPGGAAESGGSYGYPLQLRPVSGLDP